MGKVRLRLSAVQEWRQGERLPSSWNSIRKTVLFRDNYTCYYCGFSCDKYMHVHHKEGRHHDNSPDNLITLCPFCHSCLHIGHAGVNKLGSLLLLRKEIDQAKLNRMLLENAASEFFAVVRKKLPVEKDFGSDGLIELANEILQKNIVPDGRFVFFPDYEKYDIIQYLVSRQNE